MAKCEEVIVVKEFDLTLTQKELDTLYLVCRLVGGSPTKTSRKYTNDINTSLQEFISDELKQELTNQYHLEKYFDGNYSGILFCDNINEEE